MRDLIGYGGETPTLVWPNGARLAISLVVNFEEGAEQQVGDGDPATERIGEVLSVVEPGTRDMGQEQVFAYGMRAGVVAFPRCAGGAPPRSNVLLLRSCHRARADVGGRNHQARPRACLPWLALATAFGLSDARGRGARP